MEVDNINKTLKETQISMIFGRKNKINIVYQDMEKIKKAYPSVNTDNLTVGQPSTGKSRVCNFSRGQTVIVKEMISEDVVGGVIYDTEMQFVEIRGNYIILQDRKRTSNLTGSYMEYAFPIDEIGKTISVK